MCRAVSQVWYDIGLNLGAATSALTASSLQQSPSLQMSPPRSPGLIRQQLSSPGSPASDGDLQVLMQALTRAYEA